MKLGVLFDVDGNLMYDFLEGTEQPIDAILYQGEIPEGMYKPTLIDGVVVEGLTEEEIHILNTPDPYAPPTQDDRIAALEAALSSLMGV